MTMCLWLVRCNGYVALGTAHVVTGYRTAEFRCDHVLLLPHCA